jgi:hypothetical protein
LPTWRPNTARRWASFPSTTPPSTTSRPPGRTAVEIDAFASYFKAQGLYGVPKAGDIDYTKVVTLDLSSIKASLAGPKRPQDRVELGALKKTFTDLFSKPVAENGFGQAADKLNRRYSTRPGRPGPPSPTKRRRFRMVRRPATSWRWSTTIRHPTAWQALPPSTPRSATAMC